jgi:hypothetical protein
VERRTPRDECFGEFGFGAQVTLGAQCELEVRPGDRVIVTVDSPGQVTASDHLCADYPSGGLEGGFMNLCPRPS